MRMTWLAVLCAVPWCLGGCVTRYPASEADVPFTYPLAHCDGAGQVLQAAGAEATRLDGPPRLSAKNVCVTRPEAVAAPGEDPGAARQRLEAQAFARQEQHLRARLETPFIAPTPPARTFGIALSGGGSKAAAFATGVLAGLADRAMLDQANYISSVSGGGYAAYFYYAHRLLPEVRGASRPRPSNDDLYRDCIGLPYDEDAGLISGDLRAQLERGNYCNRLALQSLSSDPARQHEDLRYQAYLKCSQDMLRPGVCSMQPTGGLDSGISFASAAGTVATFLPSLIPHAVFDWGWSTSPSAKSYKDGIGLAYGATIADPGTCSAAAYTAQTRQCGPGASAAQAVFDCQSGAFDPNPVPMTFDELRRGLLTLRRQEGKGMPFWIMNATAPQYRTSAAWLTTGKEDITNSDMFEMTAVSHGSGRYGYVSASAAIHDVTVLDAVAASAAFLDASQLVYTNPAVRTGAGLLLTAANADWGLDIPNYNVSTRRRTLYRFLPFPLYYLDGNVSGASSAAPETKDRERSVFIHLIDGGNAENLGVYSLLKRGVKNVLVADAAQDDKGRFADLCGLRARLRHTPEHVLPRFLYVPGLQRFDAYCDAIDAGTFAYDIFGWNSADPVMLGCIRERPSAAPENDMCQDLDADDIRLFIVKPALNLADFIVRQRPPTAGRPVLTDCQVRGQPARQPALLNCDSAIFLMANPPRAGDCPVFPQHATVLATANSSGTIFTAYRELARQYTAGVAPLIANLVNGEPGAGARFDRMARDQHGAQVKMIANARRRTCPAPVIAIAIDIATAALTRSP